MIEKIKDDSMEFFRKTPYTVYGGWNGLALATIEITMEKTAKANIKTVSEWLIENQTGVHNGIQYVEISDTDFQKLKEKMGCPSCYLRIEKAIDRLDLSEITEQLVEICWLPKDRLLPSEKPEMSKCSVCGSENCYFGSHYKKGDENNEMSIL